MVYSLSGPCRSSGKRKCQRLCRIKKQKEHLERIRIMKRLNQGSIRLQNIYRLIDALRSHPGIARKEMAQYTSLSLMTVTNLVDILEKNHALAVLPKNRNRLPPFAPLLWCLVSWDC